MSARWFGSSPACGQNVQLLKTYMPLTDAILQTYVVIYRELQFTFNYYEQLDWYIHAHVYKYIWSVSVTHFVTTVKQIHFWIIKHRIAVAVCFSVFAAQETHPEIHTGNGSKLLHM